MPGPCDRSLKRTLFSLLGAQGEMVLSFVTFAPLILLTVSQGGMRCELTNPVQISARTQERCPSTIPGGSARVPGKKLCRSD